MHIFKSMFYTPKFHSCGNRSGEVGRHTVKSRSESSDRKSNSASHAGRIVEATDRESAEGLVDYDSEMHKTEGDGTSRARNEDCRFRTGTADRGPSRHAPEVPGDLAPGESADDELYECRAEPARLGRHF